MNLQIQLFPTYNSKFGCMRLQSFYNWIHGYVTEFEFVSARCLSFFIYSGSLLTLICVSSKVVVETVEGFIKNYRVGGRVADVVLQWFRDNLPRMTPLELWRKNLRDASSPGCRTRIIVGPSSYPIRLHLSGQIVFARKPPKTDIVSIVLEYHHTKKTQLMSDHPLQCIQTFI